MVPVGGHQCPLSVPSGGFKDYLVSLVVVVKGLLVKETLVDLKKFCGFLEELRDVLEHILGVP